MRNLSPQRQQEQMGDAQIQLALEAARVGAWEVDLCSGYCQLIGKIENIDEL